MVFHNDNTLPRDGTTEEGLSYLQESVEPLVFHNGIDYDYRVLKKLYPSFSIDFKRLKDTYLLSCLHHPHRKIPQGYPQRLGKHSLASWGAELGNYKIENEDWSKLTQNMIDRCKKDVELTEQIYPLVNKGEPGCISEEIENKFRYVISEQEAHGWLMDVEKMDEHLKYLDQGIDRLDQVITKDIPKTIKRYENVSRGLKKDGLPSSNAIKWIGEGTTGSRTYIAGDFCKVEFADINLNSTSQVKTYLLSEGWCPDEWNYKKDKRGKFVRGPDNKFIKTSPKITESSLGSLRSGIGKSLSRRFIYRHRRSQLQGWRDRLDSSNRIAAGGNTIGTNTGRVTHRNVVNVPKADDGVVFGREMREVFIASPNYTLVGADLSALENRVAAHYTFKYDNGEYAERVLKEDPHQYIADRLGITRTQGKTLTYAIMYGAQYAKVMEILSCNKTDAIAIYNRWWEINGALKELREDIYRSLESRGEMQGRPLSSKAYIKGLDGRRIYIRSWHSAMNALFQNAGSMINKVATIKIYEGMVTQGIKGHMVCNQHDEIQAEIMKKDLDKYSKLVLQSYKESGEFFKLNVPIEGEVKIGQNWSQTH
jgi:DNA polymerase I-like protein with 3'-5' exonuclease and polymerase domains